MRFTSLIIGVATVVLISACGSASKNDNQSLSEKKSELEKLKSERNRIDAQIASLNEEIARLDSSFGVKAKLVTITPVSVSPFEHYIDLQGRVDADNISYVTPRGGPAQVTAIYIKKGDYVKKGQQLLKLDDAVQLKQLDGLKTQLAYAEDIYNRTKNLWEQGIGTEVQLKTAENNVKSLKDQVNTLVAAWQMTNVTAEVSGYVEELNLRVGETFTGFSGNAPQIMIVNSSSLKVVTEVPENYIDRIDRGTPVEIKLPDVNLNFNSNIGLISQAVGINSRSVNTEAKIPHHPKVHINQVAEVRIKDYANPNAIVIPLTVLQTDESGKYVFVLSDEGGKKVARKKAVTVGEIYGEKIEVKTGLSTGDKLITQGYQGLYEGQLVTTDAK